MTRTDLDLTRSIDARGMPCPGPLMSLIGAIREGGVGDMIEVLSSDEGSKTDIPAWVAKAGHELLEVRPDDGYTSFFIRKAR
jgi:TusA-related sulfurtransferase